MAKDANVSPKFSFKGWDFLVWLKLNKDTLKALVVFVGGYSYFAGFDWKVFITGVIAVVVKLIVDSFDFYVRDVELK